MRINYLIVLLILTNLLFAQNFNDAVRLSQQSLDFDARTLALGNSTIGALGSFSNSLINPAGIATIKRDVFSMSFNSNNIKNTANFLGTSRSSDRRNGNVNQVSFIMPLPVKKGSAVLAFGYNQVNDFNSVLEFNAFNSGNTSMIQDLTEFNDDIAFELGVSYPVIDNDSMYLRDETLINGRLNQSGKLIEDGALNSWIVSGAAEIQKNLFVGGTFNIISGKYTSNRTYLEDDFDNDIYNGLLDASDPNTEDFRSFYLNDAINWDITGWDFRLGILYKMNGFLNFGATIKFPSVYQIDETYTIYGDSEFRQTFFRYDPLESFVEYEIKSPMEYSAGVSASLPFITLNAGAKYVDYSQLEFSEGFSTSELFNLNNDIQEVLKSTANWNIGAEVSLPYPALKIRGGFIYNPSPYVGDGAEFDKKYITAGLGFPIAKKLLFDFAYIHGWWENFGDNYDVDVSRTYQDLKVDKLVFSASYIFM